MNPRQFVEKHCRGFSVYSTCGCFAIFYPCVKLKENSRGDEGLKKPEIDAQAVVATGAVVLGDVTVKKDASIWYNAVVRGDRSPILIEEGTNIQDLCVLHVDENDPLTIGRNVTVGHGAILHACTIEDGALIGMGAIILNGAVIGKNSMVAAGALVTSNTVIPEGALYMGNPAKFRRMLSEEEIAANRKQAEDYVKESKCI